MATFSSISSRNETPKPTHQPRGVLRLSVMALIWSVIEPKVWPGSITGAGVGTDSVAGSMTSAPFALRHVRVGVFQCRQVGGARPRVQLREQAVVQRVVAQ